jgi:2-isopropylmalate synthase
MAIHTHPAFYPVHHAIDTYQIYNTSHMVTRMTGMPIQPNKAIVGANAFAHESGIHQDGMLKNKSTYEIIEPAILGLPSKALVLGKHSGRNAFKTHIDKLTLNTVYAEGLAKDEKLYNALFVDFKKLADARKEGVTDDDLFALLDNALHVISSGQVFYKFNSLSVMCCTGSLSTATVTITVSEGEKTISDAATGQGAIDAIFNAINRLVGFKNILASFEVKAVSEGQDSPGEVLVRIKQDTPKNSEERVNKRTKLNEEESTGVVTGKGMDEDILVASAKAYINAINRFMVNERRYQGEGRNVDV